MTEQECERDPIILSTQEFGDIEMRCRRTVTSQGGWRAQTYIAFPRSGREVPISPFQRDLCLLLKDGNIVSHADIIVGVLASHDERVLELDPSCQAIRVRSAVTRTRRTFDKLRPGLRRAISTIGRRGYQLE